MSATLCRNSINRISDRDRDHPGSAVVALAIEHTWAIGMRKALEKVGAEVALSFRIPGPVMEDALAALGLE